MLLEQLVADDDEVVDGPQAALLEGLVGGGLRQQRPRVGGVDLCSDHGGELAAGEHLVERPASGRRDDIGRRPVLLDVLVAGEHPGDRVEVDAVLVGEDRPRPHAGRHRVAAVDADLRALEVLGRPDAVPGVDGDRVVVEAAHQERRDGGERHAVRLGGQVRRQRHLADVELQGAHHAAEALDEDRDLLELEGRAVRGDGAVLERAVVALGARDGAQVQVCHVGGR